MVMTRPGSATRATAIRFSVIVPVLSEQMTVVEPSVSTAGSRRTRAPARASRQSPAASATAVTAGSPSGIADTASVIPVSSISPTGCPCRMPATGDDRADAERDDDETTSQPFDLPLERRGALAGQRHQLTHAPELGRHARRGHDRRAGAGQHGGPEVDHRRVLGERRRRSRACAPASLSTGTLSPVRDASSMRSAAL